MVHSMLGTAVQELVLFALVCRGHCSSAGLPQVAFSKPGLRDAVRFMNHSLLQAA